MSEIIDQVQEIVSNLVAQIDPSATVQTQQQEESYLVQIDSEPSGAFIGYHGESLRALQTVIAIMVRKQISEDIRVNVNVADYEQQRQVQLENMSDKAVDIVRQNQESYTMPNLNAKERRYVHMYLSELEDVKTESVGEGGERRLVIFPQANS